MRFQPDQQRYSRFAKIYITNFMRRDASWGTAQFSKVSYTERVFKGSRLKRQWFIFLNSYLSRYRLSVILIHFKNCLFRKLGPQTSLDSTLLCVETRMKVSFHNHKSFLQATTMTLATFFHPSQALWLMRQCFEKLPVKLNYRTGTDSL